RELIADAASFSQVEREAGLLAALAHPNVLETSGLTNSGRDALLALGSTSGFTLRELLRTRRELPLQEACQILSPVAAGLAYELLGGVAPGLGAHDYSPLAALDESGNAVLRRVLQLPESFGSAAEVARQLVDPPAAKSEPIVAPKSPPDSAASPPKPTTVV